MINSAEDYEFIVENDDIESRRRAVTEEAHEETWRTILANRPDLSADVAMNKRLPPSIIDCLIANRCSRTRSLIAMKRSLSEEQFQRLAGDEDESVRTMIANNKKIPPAVLEQLARDECETVFEAARQQLRNRRI